MLGKKLINAGPVSSGANTFASENFNTVLYTGNGGTQYIGGYINRGAVFNGSNSVLTTPRMFSTNSSYSISFWARMATGATNEACLIWQISGTSQRSFGLSYSGSGATYNFGFNHKFATNTGQNNLASFTPDGNWHHFAGSFNSSNNTGSIYIDGNIQGATFTLDPVSDTSNTLYIGGTYVYNGVTYYKALSGLDQVRFFNKALSSSEVTTLYGETFASTTISTTDIFDDNSGVALYQLDGNALNSGGNITDTHYFFVGDLGNQQTDARVNTTSSEFTYTPPSGYSDWGGALDPNNTSGSQTFTFSESNKRWSKVSTSGYYNSVWSTIAHNTGKKYFEIEFLNKDLQFGISKLTTADNWTNNVKNNSIVYLNYITNSWEYSTTNLSQGQVIYGASDGSSVIGIACDFDNQTFYYYYNNTLVDTATISSVSYDGTATNVTYQEATRFTPDLVWIKSRSHATDHELHDSLRSEPSRISANSTAADPGTANGFVSLIANGFTLDGTGGGGEVNTSGRDYVAWCFNAGTDAAASNTDGDITSTVKANTAAGFSIVEYTGNGSYGQTVGHGLGVEPKLVIIKNRSNARNWRTYVSALGATKYINLDESAAAGTYGSFNNTSPTTDVFSTTSSGAADRATNYANDDYIAYCFADVAGYQKIGTYTGNGSTSGPIVETGFEPAFLMIKKTDGTGSWYMYDNKRTTSNPRNIILQANESAAEGGTSYSHLDFLSNGFQLKTTNAEFNGNNGNYIYLAIAADPDQTDPTVENSFDVVTYTGTGAAQDIETDFKGDLVWIKNRDRSVDHALFDSIRGATQVIRPNQTTADGAFSDSLTSFNNNGFSLGSDAQWWVNKSGDDYVAWCWKAGDHDENLPQINTEGSIDSVVSVNDAAGFSIVKYTGTGSNATVGHGLSSAPEIRIIKGLSSGTSETQNWFVWVAGIGTNNEMILNGTGTPAFAASVMNQNQTPTSTTFPIGSDARVNQSGKDYIAYCWYSVTGHSKIGTYTGTGATGNAQTLGFRPRFIMIKSTSNAEPWFLLDSQRDPSNPVNNRLMADSSAAEDGGGVHTVDFTNTGFTANGTVGNGTNGYGVSYIYMAFK